ncbi:DUF3168 domain-containing protein [Altericroceibacterium xinjiangense]|uniref:DUF3168 domain-containing protein n=1 Tax=Altericroceibacterium xinjiangense TaxID=762261 RepID=UPI000F7F1129|nr:DUF3168 domain-containing protein [Altericroceibacterium xinjiangense]
MEISLRAALVKWLAEEPALARGINLVAEEAPARASLPWLGIVASASTDWSTKDTRGREIRLAFELHCRGDDPARAASLIETIGSRIETLPREQPGFRIISCVFLRSRAEQRPGNTRAVLLEYRFRALAS